MAVVEILMAVFGLTEEFSPQTFSFPYDSVLEPLSQSTLTPTVVQSHDFNYHFADDTHMFLFSTCHPDTKFLTSTCSYLRCLIGIWNLTCLKLNIWVFLSPKSTPPMVCNSSIHLVTQWEKAGVVFGPLFFSHCTLIQQTVMLSRATTLFKADISVASWLVNVFWILHFFSLKPFWSFTRKSDYVESSNSKKDVLYA